MFLSPSKFLSHSLNYGYLSLSFFSLFMHMLNLAKLLFSA